MKDLWFAPGDLLYEPLRPELPPFVVLSINRMHGAYVHVTILDGDTIDDEVTIHRSVNMTKYMRVEL